jgi:hypothetical protein
MSAKPLVRTAYQEYVSYNIVARLLERGGAYTYKEMSEMVGLKPTQHFKRRVRQMVEHKILDISPAFTPRGGIEFRFSLPSIEKHEGHPF